MLRLLARLERGLEQVVGRTPFGQAETGWHAHGRLNEIVHVISNSGGAIPESDGRLIQTFT